jgi:hypothetical protein
MPPRLEGNAAPLAGASTGKLSVMRGLTDPVLLPAIVTGPDFVLPGLRLLTPLRPIDPPGSSRTMMNGLNSSWPGT